MIITTDSYFHILSLAILATEILQNLTGHYDIYSNHDILDNYCSTKFSVSPHPYQMIVL